MSVKNESIKKIVILLLTFFTINCQSDKWCQVWVNGKCTYCVFKYPDSQGVCQSPTTVIPGCYSYSANNVCADCNNGYYKNSAPSALDQTCLVLDPLIRSYCAYSTLSNTTCSHCDFNVLSDAGFCYPDRRCSDPKCQQCYIDAAGLEQCWQCQNDSFLWTGEAPNICIPANQLVGCYSSSRLDICQNCFPGFYYDNGICSETSKTQYSSSRMIFVGLILSMTSLLKW